MADQTTNLSIVLSAKDQISGVLSGLKGAFGDFGNGLSGANSELGNLSKSGEGASTALKLVGGVAAGAAAAGIAAIGVQAIKSAANFQTMTTTLVTTAGESLKNIDSVRTGILNLSSQTGTSASQMSAAMYIIESAGYHAADGLTILKAAAQGAKTENADLTKVADAVTSAMRDYNEPASQAANVTSKLVAAVGAGKANFEDFTGALHAVLPLASAAHISLNDILGDMASMTVHGISAEQASDNLANAIRTLMSPSQSAAQYLAQLGITSSDLSDDLSSKGLSGTLEEVSNAIMQHMGPSGKVLIDSFNQSKTAASDAQQMIAKMPASLQKLAQQYLAGSISAKDWRTDTRNLSADQTNLATQFAATANNANGFNNLLKSGSPDALSYSQALQKATGNATTMNVALMLTGENAAYTAEAVKKVGEAHAEAGNNVEGWAIIQKNFNQQLDVAKNTMINTGTAIGTALLPGVTAVAKAFNAVIEPIATLIAKHKTLSALLFGVAFALLTVVAMTLLLDAAYGKLKDAQKILEGLTEATWLQTIAQTALDIAMDANPIGLVVIAIIALIAVFAILYVKVAPFRDFINAIWNDTYKIIHSNVGLIIAALDPFIAAPILIIRYWSDITAFFERLWKDIPEAFDHSKAIMALMAPFVALPILIISKWKAIEEFFSTLFTNPTQAFHQFTTAISDSWNSLTNDAQFWATKLWHGILDGFGIIDKDAQRVGNDLVYYIGKGWDDATTIARKLPGDLLKELEKAFQADVDFLSNIGIELVGGLKKGWDGVVRNAPQWGKDLVKAIERGLLDLAKYDLASIISWGKSIASAGKQALQFGKDIIKDISTGFMGAVHTVGSWGSTIITTAKNGFNNGLKTVPQWGRDIVNAIISGLKSAWHGIESFFTSLPDLLKPSVQKSGQNTAQNHIDGIANSFKDMSKMKKIGEYLTIGLLVILLGIPAAILFGIISIGIFIINEIVASIKDSIHLVGQFGSWLLNEILSAISGIGRWLYSAGSNLLDGFVQGIEDDAGKVFKAVENIGSTAVSKLKGVLKIFSPSQVFAEIGQNVSLGMAQGIEKSSSSVANATRSIVPTVRMQGNTIISGTATQAAASSTTAVTSVQTPANTAGTSTATGGNINLSVNLGTYAGQPGELNSLATTIYQQLQVIARQHGQASALPNIGIRPN